MELGLAIGRYATVQFLNRLSCILANREQGPSFVYTRTRTDQEPYRDEDAATDTCRMLYVQASFVLSLYGHRAVAVLAVSRFSVVSPNMKQDPTPVYSIVIGWKVIVLTTYVAYYSKKMWLVWLVGQGWLPQRGDRPIPHCCWGKYEATATVKCGLYACISASKRTGSSPGA